MKKIISCILVLFCSFSFVACNNTNNTDNGQGLAFYLKEDGTYAVAVGNARYVKKIIIPSEYNGKPVTEIARGGFSAQSGDGYNPEMKGSLLLKEIVIPDSVTIIGERAFYFCLELETIVIGHGVELIEYGAIDSCYNLKNIYYTGSAQDWENIEIKDYNSILSRVQFDYSISNGQ
jgi:hypothetical protein